MEGIDSGSGEMAARFPNGSIINDLLPDAVWKSSVTCGERSFTDIEMVRSEILSAATISLLKESSLSIHTLMNVTLEDEREE